MINDTRWPLRVALLHTAVVVMMVWVKNGLHGSRIAVAADRILRVVDAPVLWIADPILQSFTLRAEWFYRNVYLALGVHEVLVYGSVGALFYSIVCWAIVRIIRRRSGAYHLPPEDDNPLRVTQDREKNT